MADGEFSPLPLLWEPFSPLACDVVACGSSALQCLRTAHLIAAHVLLHSRHICVDTSSWGAMLTHNSLLIAAQYI